MVNDLPEDTPADPNESEQPTASEPTAAEQPAAEEPTVAEEATVAEETPVSDDTAASKSEEAASDEATADEETSVVETPIDPTTGLPELTLGSGAIAEEDLEPIAPEMIRGKIDRFGVAMGTGRRKTSVARVRVKDGTGVMTINGRSLEEFCQIERDRAMIEGPLRATETFGSVDVWVRVNGGGTTGQAGAILLGIARALQVRNPELHHRLSTGGYLTRDSRMVERKKYGFKKARKSFQFSKR